MVTPTILATVTLGSTKNVLTMNAKYARSTATTTMGAIIFFMCDLLKTTPSRAGFVLFSHDLSLASCNSTAEE